MAFDSGLADRVRNVMLMRGTAFVEKKMFGGLAFMVNGHMCCGIVKSDLMLRLSRETVEASLKQPHTRPMDFTGKVMKTMLYVDSRGIDTEAALERWIALAEKFAGNGV
ncbi:MAG: TfoX/Sxy family protein [Acidobacteria bacterium]|nr:TfoX/Sxy family protein [Acidobacteriota bacterium]